MIQILSESSRMMKIVPCMHDTIHLKKMAAGISGSLIVTYLTGLWGDLFISEHYFIKESYNASYCLAELAQEKSCSMPRCTILFHSLLLLK